MQCSLNDIDISDFFFSEHHHISRCKCLSGNSLSSLFAMCLLNLQSTQVYLLRNEIPNIKWKDNWPNSPSLCSICRVIITSNQSFQNEYRKTVLTISVWSNQLKWITETKTWIVQYHLKAQSRVWSAMMLWRNGFCKKRTFAHTITGRNTRYTSRLL